MQLVHDGRALSKESAGWFVVVWAAEAAEGTHETDKHLRERRHPLLRQRIFNGFQEARTARGLRGMYADAAMAWQLNPIALIVLAYTSATVATTYFGLDDPTRAAMFALAWTLPVPRLVLRHRRGHEAHALSSVAIDCAGRSRRLTFIVLGVLPWLALPWLFRTFPEAILWLSWPTPAPAQWLGAALICGVVLMPPSWSLGANAATAMSIILITGNPFLSLVSTGGVTALWLASRPAAATPDLATDGTCIAQTDIVTIGTA